MNMERAKDVVRAMFDESIDIIRTMKITGLTEERLLRLKNANVAV